MELRPVEQLPSVRRRTTIVNQVAEQVRQNPGVWYATDLKPYLRKQLVDAGLEATVRDGMLYVRG